MPSRDIDVALLRSFVAVADSGRMALAARIVHRSQGAISQQMARLEALVGARLFDRGPQATRLTVEGERLLVGARRMLAENDALFAYITGCDFIGEVRLGVPPDVIGLLVPPVLREFRKHHPKVRVVLTGQGSRALRAGLANGDLDLVITTDMFAADGDGLLLKDNLVWVSAPDTSCLTARPLPVALGREDCAFRAAMVSALATHGIEWAPICQFGNLETVIATIEADMAIGAFLARTVPEKLSKLGQSAKLPRLPACYVNLSQSPSSMSATARELATLLREFCATVT